MNELIDRIFLVPQQGGTRDTFEPWNLLMQRAAQEDANNIMIYVVIGFIMSYFQNEEKLKDMMCTTDEERIVFESTVCANIMNQDALLKGNLKEFS